MKKRHLVWFYTGLCLLVIVLLFGALLLHNKIVIFPPSTNKYPIWGVDVSYYQGEIDWKTLEEQGVRFAFIKATEGSSHKDERYETNWADVRQTSIKAGAYHFFSFESNGKDQGEHYIRVVQKTEDMLPPVVDVEFYGKYATEKPDAGETRKQLKELLLTLEENYGTKPIIYATESSYSRYIRGYFEEYPLWIRNVRFSPNISMPGKWLFWQYSSEGELNGYIGTQKYIDLNVFSGSEEEWEDYLLSIQTKK